MLNELLEYRHGHRANIPTDLRGLHDMLRVPDAGHQHFRLVLVVAENSDDVSDQLHAVVADIVQAADEGADAPRTGFSGKQCLIR